MNICRTVSEGAAPRQWRSPRRGARRVGEPTPLQSGTLYTQSGDGSALVDEKSLTYF